MMRKKISLVLCLLLACVPLAATAEEAAAPISTNRSGLIFSGKVEARDTVTIAAPFGGTVQDFQLKAGDVVKKDAALFTLDTIKITAPCDGTVRGVFAQAGDSAAYIQNRYGGLCFIEPSRDIMATATTSGGYSSKDNDVLYNGERVYLEQTSGGSDANEGVGRISGIDGDNFTVEITSGDLELRDTVNIFRKSNYENESRIGRGLISATPFLPISGDGTILAVSAWDGGAVKRGDVLFEVVTGTLEGQDIPSATISAPKDGIIATVTATPGQMANKDQPLATLYTMDKLQLASTISEMDLTGVSIGTSVDVVLDSLPGKVYEGTVKSIGGIGQATDDYTEFPIYIEFTPDSDVRLGMSATAYVR